MSVPARITVNGCRTGLPFCWALLPITTAKNKIHQHFFIRCSADSDQTPWKALRILRLGGANHSIGFNLYQHLPRNPRANLYHRSRRTNVAEEFAMRLADLLPIGDVDDEHSGAHYILQCSPGLVQSLLNVLQRLYGLGVNIAHADDLAGRARGCRPGHMHVWANLNRTGVTDYRFPGRAARDVLPFHNVNSFPGRSL